MFRLLILFLLFSGPALAQQEGALEDLTGIPVMEGLSEVEDARLVFDKPEGRIIHVEFEGDLPPDQVTAFYSETLHQLGWSLEGELVDAGQSTLIFVRDEEQLLFILSALQPLKAVIELGPVSDQAG